MGVLVGSVMGPRERLVTQGPAALSDVDLVALLLSHGTKGAPAEMLARNVLVQCGGLRGIQGRRASEIAGVRGMGLAKACRVLAAVELAKRLAASAEKPFIFNGAKDVGKYAASYAFEREEVFVALAVNQRNRLQGEWIVARGWESGINLTPRQVFTLLVKESVARVIFVHNHPGGDPQPSPEDIRFTARLLEGARLLDIKVLDHVVVASGGFVSLREVASDRLVFDG